MRINVKAIGRRTAMVTVAAMGLASIAGCSGPAREADRSGAAPGPASTVLECPAYFDADAGSPKVTRTGTLVPDGADRALLCSYPFTEQTSKYPLGASTPSSGAAVEVVSHLNALTLRVAEDEGLDGCAAAGRTMYIIVLTYPDRSGVAVNIDPNCASVEQGGAVASIGRLPELLAAWPTPQGQW